MNKFIKILLVSIIFIFTTGILLLESNNTITKKQDTIYAHYRGYEMEFIYGINIEQIEYIPCYKLTREQYNQLVGLFPKEIPLFPNMAERAQLRKYFDVRLAIHDAGDGDILIDADGNILSDNYYGVVDTNAIMLLFQNFKNLEECGVCPFDNRLKNTP